MKFTVKWYDIRTVYTEVEAKSINDAQNKVLNGEGDEVDWSGSGSPTTKKDIEEIYESK